MEKNKLVKVYLALWILFAIVFGAMLVCLYLTQNNNFLSYAGIFASFFSAFIIAWVVERQNINDFVRKKEKIRKLYLTEQLYEIVSYIRLMLRLNHILSSDLKPCFEFEEINYDNIALNLNLLYYVKTEERNDELDYLLEFFKKTKELELPTFMLINNMQIQNALYETNIFENEEIDLFSQLLEEVEYISNAYDSYNINTTSLLFNDLITVIENLDKLYNISLYITTFDLEAYMNEISLREQQDNALYEHIEELMDFVEEYNESKNKQQ